MSLAEFAIAVAATVLIGWRFARGGISVGGLVGACITVVFYLGAYARFRVWRSWAQLQEAMRRSRDA